MFNKKLSFFFMMILLALGSTQIGLVGAELAQGSPNISIDTENIGFKVTGGQNVPKYTFWAPSAPETQYHVQFLKIFEVNDTNGNGAYDAGTDSMVSQSSQALA